MEFTVAEKLAVLAIKPGGGWAISESRLGTLLAAGAIGELLIGGQIDVVDGEVQTINAAPSAFLEDIQGKIDGLSIASNKVLAASGGKTTLNAVYRRLADRALVEQDTGWFARWRLTSQTDGGTDGDEALARDIDEDSARDIATDLRAALIAGELTARDRMTVQLLDAARLLGWLTIPRSELDAARESLRPRPWIAEALQRRLATQSFRL